MSLRKYAGLFVFTAALMSSGVAIADDASIDQVYQAVESGHLAQAQTMMDKVLKDHPNSAKAHYVEAELLAKGGNLSGAQSELSNAERLDPSGAFAKSSSIQELRAQIAAGQRARPMQNNFAPQPPVQYQQRSSGGLPWVMIIVVLAVIAFIVMVARSMGRRNVVMAPGGYPAGGGYGPGGYPMGGGGMMGGGMMGGGMGSGIVGGLATGAAVGAGIVAGEELMHHFTDGNQGGNYIPNQGGGGWDNAQPNSDMGGNDFGVSDAGSWDSGGGGGGDMGGGGGGDW